MPRGTAVENSILPSISAGAVSWELVSETSPVSTALRLLSLAILFSSRPAIISVEGAALFSFIVAVILLAIVIFSALVGPV